MKKIQVSKISGIKRQEFEIVKRTGIHHTDSRRKNMNWASSTKNSISLVIQTVENFKA